MRRLGSISYWDYACDVAVVDTLAYVATRGSGLKIVNIANPSQPVEIGYSDTPRYAYGLAVSGNYAYVADYSGGLRVVNITNPGLYP